MEILWNGLGKGFAGIVFWGLLKIPKKEIQLEHIFKVEKQGILEECLDLGFENGEIGDDWDSRGIAKIEEITEDNN